MYRHTAPLHCSTIISLFGSNLAESEIYIMKKDAFVSKKNQTYKKKLKERVNKSMFLRKKFFANISQLITFAHV